MQLKMNKKDSLIKKAIIPVIILSILIGLFLMGKNLPQQIDPKENNSMSVSIEYITRGTGPQAQNGNTCVLHYTGKLENGTKFDSSVDRNEPFAFRLGARQVISGWEHTVAQMKVGDKVVATIPSDLAYGPRGIPGVIPGGATLIFEMELLGLK